MATDKTTDNATDGATTNPSSGPGHANLVDATPSDAGLSTTGLSAAEIEPEMPASPLQGQPVAIPPVPIDGPTPPGVPSAAAPSITGVVPAEPDADEADTV